MKNAIIYARVSTKDQHPENQVKQLKEFAGARGFTIVKVYQEKRSGKKNEHCFSMET
jgi:DNA invertase Pin-like site-specific DNA recombinase